MLNVLARFAPIFLATALSAATPGWSISLAQGLGNQDHPFGFGGALGVTFLFNEEQKTQGRLRLEYLSLGKGTGVTRNYWTPGGSETYSTALHGGDFFQLAYDWRFRMGEGKPSIILGVGGYTANRYSTVGLTGTSKFIMEDATKLQQQGVTGTLGVGLSLSPKVDLELRFDAYGDFSTGQVPTKINLTPSHITLALQIRP